LEAFFVPNSAEKLPASSAPFCLPRFAENNPPLLHHSLGTIKEETHAPPARNAA
jgi:hypothetical protein